MLPVTRMPTTAEILDRVAKMIRQILSDQAIALLTRKGRD